MRTLNILSVALCLSTAHGSIVYTRDANNVVTVTAKGQMLSTGKFKPLEHADMDKAADDLAANNKTANMTRRSDSSDLQPFHSRRLYEEAPSHALTERQAEGVISLFFGPAAVAIYITTAAIVVGTLAIVNIKGWSEKREAFTKSTTNEMYSQLQKNKTLADAAPAAMCYNEAYDSRDPSHIGGVSNQKLKSFPLHTDYECFFIVAPNDVYTRGDGGFINLSVTYDGNRCTFDKETADVYCPK